jgi:hypothetical protein
MAGRKAGKAVVHAVEEFDYEGYQEALQMEQTFSGDVDYPDDVPLLEEEDDFGSEEYDEEEYEDLESDLLRAEDTLDADLRAAEDESDLDDAQIETLISRVDLNDVVRQGMSFDELMPKKIKKTGVINQRKEKKYQHGLLVIREDVTITPASCKRLDCTFDAAKACGFKKGRDIRGEPKIVRINGVVQRKPGDVIRKGTFWDTVPAGKKKLVLIALKKHVIEKHSHQDESMFDEAERPKSWLTPGLMLP